MKFVLCSTSTYSELYQAESHNWVRIIDHTSLLGFKNIVVVIHDCWMYEINDDRIDYLEAQLTALADFGYISITFQSSEGWAEEYVYKEESPIEEQPQLEFPPSTRAVVAYEVEDSGCEGGACKI